MKNVVSGSEAATPLLVKRLDKKGLSGAADAGRALKERVAANAIARVNWPEFSYRPEVSFRIGHVQDEIWLRFDVSEERVRGLETRLHGDVYKDSCVEFFVSFDRVNFYNLEVNCIGTKHMGYGPSRHGRTFVSPEMMRLIAAHSTLGDKPFEEKDGGFEWSLSLRVPTAVFMFDSLKGLSGLVAAANFYKIGDALAVPHYLSWAPVLAPKPDYHRPEFFRDIRFS